MFSLSDNSNWEISFSIFYVSDGSLDGVSDFSEELESEADDLSAAGQLLGG